MFVLTQYTYNSKGRMIDADPEAIFKTHDAITTELRNIAKSYEDNERQPIVTWGVSSLSVQFVDGLKREFVFEISRVGVKA